MSLSFFEKIPVKNGKREFGLNDFYFSLGLTNTVCDKILRSAVAQW